MVKRNEYIIANLELEKLIKQLDLGKDVDDKLILVSNIIEKYEETNYLMDMLS
ncbi:hypothetical protein [Polaribacter sp. Asnod6-C07]|uniref:hypothetical protein n=1 Tax=Polaribacter sp. Asnod6-C07 TaxID=3160582 RepID=UPI00386F6D1B